MKDRDKKDSKNPAVPEVPQAIEENAQEKFVSVADAVNKEFDKRGYESDISSLKGGQRFFTTVMIGVIVVLFIAFLGFVLDAWKTHTETVQQNTDTIKNIEQKNLDLRDKLLNQRMDYLQNEINKLKPTPTP